MASHRHLPRADSSLAKRLAGHVKKRVIMQVHAGQGIIDARLRSTRKTKPVIMIFFSCSSLYIMYS